MTKTRKIFGSISLAAALALGLSAGTAQAADPPSTFKKCKACHTYDEGGKNRVGPNLWNVADNTIGSKEGYKYSKAFKAANEAGQVWDDASMDAFLAKPKAFMKGTKMGFPGMKKDDERAEMVAWLKTLK